MTPPTTPPTPQSRRPGVVATQGTPSTALDRAAHNGLADEVAAVEAARARLGQHLEVLQDEVKAQMGATVEKILWKVAAAGTAIAAGLVTRKALERGWRALRHEDPPGNPADASTGWGEAIAWSLATGVGLAAAKLVATRGAAAGWEKATGTRPPMA